MRVIAPRLFDPELNQIVVIVPLWRLKLRGSVMTAKSKFLTTLGSIAFGIGSISGTSQAVAADLTPTYLQSSDIFRLVGLLTEACSFDTFGSQTLATQILRCCPIIAQAGPENVDFLRALATGNRSDPRLAPLDSRLVEVLLQCQDAALARLVQLALTTATGAGPGPRDTDIYTG
jgi:hypothetical protein